MAKLNLSKELTIEKLSEQIRSQLGNSLQFNIKNNRLRIVENQFCGCSITLKQNNESNRCYIFGFMPSILARLGLFIGVLGLFSFITSLLIGQFNVVAGGIIPFVIYLILVDLPSQNLVNKITQIIRSSSFNQDEISIDTVKSNRFKSWILIGLSFVALVLTIFISRPKKQIFIPLNQPTHTTDTNEPQNFKDFEQLIAEGEIQAKTQMIKGNDTIAIDFQISVKIKDGYFSFIEVGQEVGISVPDYPDIKFRGTLEKIYPIVSVDNPQIELLFGFSQTDSRLKEGTKVEVNIINRKNLN